MISSIGGALIPVPGAASRFAQRAALSGWDVLITTARGPAVGPDLEPVFETRTEARSTEEGVGNRRVDTDVVKVTESVAVRCQRGSDYLIAIWTDGKFDFGGRPWAMRAMSSRQAIQHVTESHTWPCRWLPSSRRGMQVCDNHGESREAQ